MLINTLGKGIVWTTFIYIIAFLLVLLIVVHLLGNKMRIKKNVKKKSKKFFKKYSENSVNVTELLKKLKESKKYKGKFSNYSGKEKRKAKKFLLDWLKNIPLYIELNHLDKDKKLSKLHIAITKDPTLKNIEKNKVWKFKFYYNNDNKNAKRNYKSLIKFMNKNLVAYSVIDVIAHIFSKENDYVNKESFNGYSVTENHYYITYYIN